MLYGNNCMRAVVNNMIVLPDNKFIYVSSLYHSFNSFYNCFNFPCIYFVIILIHFCVKHFEFP